MSIGDERYIGMLGICRQILTHKDPRQRRRNLAIAFENWSRNLDEGLITPEEHYRGVVMIQTVLALSIAQEQFN
jgi:hypothetical protein